MTQCDLGRAQFRGDTIEDATTESGAERTGGLPFRDESLDDLVGVSFLDTEWHSNM